MKKSKQNVLQRRREVILIYLLKAKFLYCSLVNNQTDRFEFFFFCTHHVITVLLSCKSDAVKFLLRYVESFFDCFVEHEIKW